MLSIIFAKMPLMPPLRFSLFFGVFVIFSRHYAAVGR